MSKIAIASDSTAYLPEAFIRQHDIHIVPLRVVFGEEAYKELEEIPTDDFYKKVREADELPTTTQPPIGDFVQLYEDLAADDVTDVIVITLSNAISGTFETANSAKTMVDGINVHVVDCEFTCAPQGYYVQEAAALRDEGADVETILKRMDTMKANGMEAYFMVDDLNHLHRGGRLSGAELIVGSLLRVKPIITFKDQKIKPFDKVRTKKKAMNRIKDLLSEDASRGGRIRAAVIDANNPEMARELKDWVKTKFPDIELDHSYFGPVIGTHVGEGTVGFTWYRP